MPGIPLPPPNTAAIQGPPPAPQYNLLLTASSSVGHVHLVVGRNALAASRAQKSLDAGALVTIVAPAAATASHGHSHDNRDHDRDYDYDDDLPYSLQQHVEAGEARWLQRRLDVDRDLETLGRAEVGGVVDLVWLTGSPDDGSAPPRIAPFVVPPPPPPCGG